MGMIRKPQGKGFVKKKDIANLIREAIPATPRIPGQKLNASTHCYVRNETGEAREVFSVFRIGGSLITPDDSEPLYKFNEAMLSGEEVAEDDESGICVVQDHAGDDSRLRVAVYSGVTKVRLTGPQGGPDTDNKHATTREGAYTLEASDSGPCVILYDPGPADEERIAIVRIGGSGSSGGDGGNEEPTACNTCGEFAALGTIEIEGLGVVSQNVEWENPIPGSGPDLVVAVLDPDLLALGTYEYHPLDDQEIEVECEEEEE